MLRIALFAFIASLALAQDNNPINLQGITSPDDFNEFDKADINLYKPCTDLEGFIPGMVGWWKGRTQMTENTYLREYDIHNIQADGSGFVSGRSDKDHTKITRETPTKMWCKKHPNGVDKSIKVQYGPTRYGQLICIGAEIPSDNKDLMVLGVNQVLFTDARLPMLEPVALDCLNYLYQSKYNSFTVWADQVYAPSYVEWDRTEEPAKGSDWSVGKKDALLTLLKALTKN